MNHTMKLHVDPFERTKNGSQIIELRLNDAKRQQIKLGDTITFTKAPEQTEKVATEVTALLHYPTFKDLVFDFPIDYLGGKDRTALLKDVHEYYTEEDEAQQGVLGIKFTLL